MHIGISELGAGACLLYTDKDLNKPSNAIGIMNTYTTNSDYQNILAWGGGGGIFYTK